MNKTLQTLLYSSSGFFLVYVSSQLYQYLTSYFSNTDTKSPYKPPSVLVYEVFPFTFVPGQQIEEIYVNLESFEILAKVFTFVLTLGN